MNAKCLQCGNTFEVDYPCKAKTRKFCSKRCSAQYKWEHTVRNNVRYTCEVCGKEFEVPKSDHRVKEGKKIRFCSKPCMGIGTRTGEIRKCLYCKNEFYSTRTVFCSQDCARKYRVQNYKHKTYMENGYIVEYHNGYNKKGNVKQHRRIMEEYLGRKLAADEVVHHKNGIKTDNRIENLEVKSWSEHSSDHRKQEKAEGKHLFGGYHNN